MLSLGVTAACMIVGIDNVAVTAKTIYLAKIGPVPGGKTVVKNDYSVGAWVVVVIKITAKEISVLILKGILAAEKSGKILHREIENSIIGIMS